ncbi:MAG: ABC transporter ATP-binding protein [Oscillospiraceae bacterium]|jgi:iron complex transport system ATP-binding protein|nr:ABC transporter ATP-binding protein [Oscillospiraceae bacterium]
MLLEIRDLTVKYGAMTILDDVSFSVDEGQWLMIAGPNGAGKSTIVNAIMSQAPYTGNVRVCGENIVKIRPRDLARRVGVLSQSHNVGYAFSVEEVVRLGRYSHTRRVFSRDDGGDAAAVDAAIEMCGLRPMLNQSVLTLSGGELQRTFLAQLFAQNPSVLVLDEPTNHLDLVYQKQIFALISEWLKTPNRAVVSVVHDLSLARAYGTHALLLDRGKLVASGVPRDVFSRENLERVYAMDVFAWMRDMLGQWDDGDS